MDMIPSSIVIYIIYLSSYTFPVGKELAFGKAKFI